MRLLRSVFQALMKTVLRIRGGQVLVHINGFLSADRPKSRADRVSFQSAAGCGARGRRGPTISAVWGMPRNATTPPSPRPSSAGPHRDSAGIRYRGRWIGSRCQRRDENEQVVAVACIGCAPVLDTAIAEQPPETRQPIEIGGPDGRIAVASQCIGTEFIGKEQDQIGFATDPCAAAMHGSNPDSIVAPAERISRRRDKSYTVIARSYSASAWVSGLAC